MKHILRATIIVAASLLFSCSPASKGKSAGNDYCKCNDKDGIMEIGKCKKDVLNKSKKDLENSEFQEAFWQAVSDCN